MSGLMLGCEGCVCLVRSIGRMRIEIIQQNMISMIVYVSAKIYYTVYSKYEYGEKA